jgi:small subunit ribosomal protein S1
MSETSREVPQAEAVEDPETEAVLTAAGEATEADSATPETADEPTAAAAEGGAASADFAGEASDDAAAEQPAAAEAAPSDAEASKGEGSEDDSISPAVLALKERLASNEVVEGKVIGWNKGGFHVVCEGVTAFCPNSEMELGKTRTPKEYLDNTYEFLVQRIEDSGRRVVLSRSRFLQGVRSERRAQAREKVQVGAEISGKVASLTNFGAFVDLGGVQGLVHVSEISRRRVEDPAKVLAVGQQVKVKVLKVEQGGKRVSLSMKALEPDPWQGVAERFTEGSVVQGTVERTASFGAFVMLEPGLTGLLPASAMNLPRDASINRMYSPGKQLAVQVMSVDPRRRRISLALEGSQTEGSRSDFENYKKSTADASGGGFNALAAAFQKLQK